MKVEEFKNLRFKNEGFIHVRTEVRTEVRIQK